jgi:hypothetical protein
MTNLITLKLFNTSIHRLLFFSSSLLLLMSCQSNQKADTAQTTNSLNCDHAKNILIHIDSLPNSHLNLYSIRAIDLNEIKNIYQFRPSHRSHTWLNVEYHLDSLNKIPLSIQIKSSLETLNDFQLPIPTSLRQENVINILLNLKGMYLFDGEIISLDSIENKIFHSYINSMNENKEGIIPTILFQWDEGVEEEIFKKTMNVILKAYYRFATAQAHSIYQKDLCELTQDEYETIKSNYPFYFKTSSIERIQDIYNWHIIENETIYLLSNAEPIRTNTLRSIPKKCCSQSNSTE